MNFGLEKAERAAASPREGPLLASAFASARACLRKLQPDFQFFATALGGGLLLYIAGPSARLRACLGLESVRQDRAGRSLPVAEARNSLTVVRDLRRLQPVLSLYRFLFLAIKAAYSIDISIASGLAIPLPATSNAVP